MGQHHVAVQVHYRGQVQPPAAKHLYLRHVSHQFLERGGRSEVPGKKVRRVSCIAPAAAVTLAAVGADKAHGTHAAVDRLEVHAHAAAFHRRSHLAASVLTAAAVEDVRYQRVLLRETAPGMQ